MQKNVPVFKTVLTEHTVYNRIGLHIYISDVVCAITLGIKMKESATKEKRAIKLASGI